MDMRNKGWLRLALWTGVLWMLCAAALAEGVSWTGREWDGSTEGEAPLRNCDIVSIGREAARVDSIPYDTFEHAAEGATDYNKELSPYYRLLSQTSWSFRWFENPEAAEAAADFFHPAYDDGDWDAIFVPSVWQTEGYDYPIYTSTTQKFARQSGNTDIGYPRDLPAAPTVYNPVGLYRHTFDVPGSWAERRVYISFEGVNAAMYLWVNGVQAGYAEDSFTTHTFDITDYLHAGEENLLAVKVYRWCDGSWLEDQDMIDLSGIFRDVYLYATPQVQVRDFSIVTDFDATYTDSVVRFTAQLRNNAQEAGKMRLRLRLMDRDGREIPLTGAEQTVNLAGKEERELRLDIPVAAPRKWSAEDPYLYTLVLEEETAQGTVYESYQVGFRKITYKTTASGWFEGETTQHDLLRINGQPLSFRGVNRHETHPELGYALTREVMEEDIRILKENNINAVRTSHYPNHPYWYYLCDKYGIYVVDEANVECHSNMTTENERLTEYLSAAIIDREYSMVRRDRNHACVVMWSLGNENKNPEILRTILVQPYADPEGTERVLHAYTCDRPWHYEQAKDMVETGIDVRSGMYALPEELIAHGEADGALPMIECEYEHAMGNSLGNMDEYWAAFDTYRNLQGGFIWDLVDQSIALESEDGESYFGYGGDFGEQVHDGNFCANGLLLPDRTLQPEMAEVKYHYQTVKFSDADVMNGWVEVRNYALFTDLADKYALHWALMREGEVLQEGVLEREALHVPCVDPKTNQPGRAQIRIPFTWEDGDLVAGCAYFLNLTVILREAEGLLPAGHVVAREQFELSPRLPDAPEETLPQVQASQADGLVTVSGAGFELCLEEATGRITRYEADGRALVVPGSGPQGNFYRAATDNDTGFGYGLFVFNQAWKDAGDYVVEHCQVQAEAERVEILLNGVYPALNGLRLDMRYTVYGDGAVAAEVEITPQYNESLVYIPVAGVEIRVPGDFEQLTYVGRGPEENYIDRNRGALVGRYATTVTDNFVPYVKSSETGNRTDVRWVALTDENGFGLLAAAETTLEMSALHYTSSELDRRVHPYELHALEDTVLRLNAVQIGLGGDNSWSRIVTHEQYLPHDPAYAYSFVLAPLRPGEDAGAKSVQLRNRLAAQ